MNTKFACMTGAAAAAVLAGGLALAQNMEGITVQGTRATTKTHAGFTTSGVEVLDISLGYAVSPSGLDLASHAGALEFEKRIHEAAAAACREIGREYPDSTPDEQTCTRIAADKAMVKAHELEAAADRKAAK